jgi:hypothetical protein
MSFLWAHFNVMRLNAVEQGKIITVHHAVRRES